MAVWEGMTSRLIKKAFAINVPAKNPQVSMFAIVFLYASRRNVVRSVGGRKIVRSGAPFSRYAAGAKICTGSGVCIRAAGNSETLPGHGGSAITPPFGFGGSAGGNLMVSLGAPGGGAYGV